MANKKISQLDAGTAALTDVLPASNSGGTATQKVTVQSMLDLESRWDIFKPGAPTNLSVEMQSGQAVLTWTAPSVVAQAPVTDYLVQFSSNNGATWSLFSDGVSATAGTTVTGLTNGSSYRFRVSAINAVGAGPYCAASTAASYVEVPGQPTSVSGTSGNQQVSLSWSAPSSNGGGAITDYIVQYSSDSGTNWSTFSDGTSTNLAALVTGLTNGTAYVFRVAAVNSAGTGSYSSASSPVTPDAPVNPPNAPTGVSGTSGDGQVSLTWSAPGDNGGASITDYVVQYSSDSGSNWSTFADGTSTSTSAVVTGLTNGTAYVFRVAATNSAGTGSYSSASSAVTPAAAPGAPGTPTPVAGDGQVSLSWTAPSSNGGAAITDYVVQYSTDSGATANTFADGTSTSLSAVVTGLTNGTSYVFRVAAVNSAGTGSYSSWSSAATPTAAGADLTITSQPSNDISQTYTDQATFVIAASHTGQTVSYQWQYWGHDPNTYTPDWFNISGATSSTLNLQGSNAAGFNIDSMTSDIKLRCVVSTTGSGGPIYSSHVHWLTMWNLLLVPNYYGPNSYPDGTTTVNGQTYQTWTTVATETITLNLDEMGFWNADPTWFSSNIATTRLQSSADASTWSDVQTWNNRNYISGITKNLSWPASSQTVYYRFKIEVNWPPTASNGTTSSNDTITPIYAGRVKITWP